MDIITSTKNQFVKEAKSLSEKKFRDQAGLFLVESINILKDLPKDVEVKMIFATENRQSDVEKLLAHTRARVYYVSEIVMKHMADTVTPYGIVAVLRKPEIAFSFPKGNALLLDRISDPGNLGTILRTAMATDFLDVYLLDTTDVYSPKVVRATLGALFKVRICSVSLQEALDLISSTDSIALDMNGEDITLSKLSGPLLFVAGNEANGVRVELIEKVKSTKSLPMKNNIESLNVAVATAVAMYQTI